MKMLLCEEILKSLQYILVLKNIAILHKKSNFSLLFFRWLYINSDYNAEVLCPMCFQQYENLALFKLIFLKVEKNYSDKIVIYFFT